MPANIKGTPLMVNGIALRHLARQRLGPRRARRPRAVALLLAHEGQHAHRQSRRGHLERLPLLRDARQLLRVARGADGEGALAQGPRRLQPAVLLDDGADRRRQPRDRRHRQRSRFARIHPVVRSGDRRGAVAVLHGADEGRRPGPRHVAQPRRRPIRRRASLAARRLRSGDEALHLRHRQSRSRPTPRAAARATTSSPARWSPSTSTPARWRGTSRPRRTTCTTGTRRRRRSSSTR